MAECLSLVNHSKLCPAIWWQKWKRFIRGIQICFKIESILIENISRQKFCHTVELKLFIFQFKKKK